MTGSLSCSRAWIGLNLGQAITTLLCLLNFGLAFNTDRYSGYKVMRLHPGTDDETRTLLRLLAKTGNGNDVNVWPARGRRSTSMDIMVSPSEMADLLELIEYLQIPSETLVDDLRLALDDHKNELFSAEREAPFNLLRYNTLEEISAWLWQQASSQPDMMELLTIGHSWEQRPIQVVRMQSPSRGGSADPRPAIWLDAGIHANEWVGPATLLFYINEILTKYNYDPEITSLLDKFDIYILPVFNVDGYAYTWTEDRLWRKSRSHWNSSSECAGVDMNRNWPHEWGHQPGVSTDPCSVIYGGPHAQSEPEVQAVIRFLQDRADVIKAYMAFHSYSQLWMMPYSYTADTPKDYQELKNISEQAADAIHGKFGKEYRYGTVTELLGEASGSSIDFTYARLGVKYSFGLELRDDGLFGSLLPPSQIAPTAQESLEGVKTMAQLIRDRI